MENGVVQRVWIHRGRAFKDLVPQRKNLDRIALKRQISGLKATVICRKDRFYNKSSFNEELQGIFIAKGIDNINGGW